MNRTLTFHVLIDRYSTSSRAILSIFQKRLSLIDPELKHNKLRLKKHKDPDEIQSKLSKVTKTLNALNTATHREVESTVDQVAAKFFGVTVRWRRKPVQKPWLVNWSSPLIH